MFSPFRRLLTRTLWIKCHVYLALSLGLLFALIGVSGSLCIYSQGIDQLLNPQLVITKPQGEMLSLDKLFAAIRQAHPNRNDSWTLELPRTPNDVLIAWFERPSESVDKWYAPLMVAVNPYSGEIIDSRLWGQTFSSWLLDLHTQLLLDGTGRNLMAALAVMLVISVGSGLYLWWPGLARLKQAFMIRHNQGLMRLLFDLHRLLGLFSTGFLLLLAFTGFHLAYPSLLESLTASAGMGHGDAGPNVRSTAVPNNRPVGLAEAVLVARGLFPSSQVSRVTTPRGDLGTYRINLRQRNELNQHHPFTNVWVDRWSGQIRSVSNPIKFSGGQLFTTWQWPLHTGEALGEQGRLLWFFIGLTPMLLYISGMLHWLHRKGWVEDKPLDLGQLAQSSYQNLLKQGRHYGTKLWLWLKPWLVRLQAYLSNKIKPWLR